MSIKSKWIGSSQVYYDDFEFRWVRAYGADVRAWEMRFGSDFTTAKEYTKTVVEAGAGDSTMVQGITAGDRALLTNAGNENDGTNLQVIGTPFALTAAHPLYFGAKIAVSNASECDLLVGLANTDTTLMSAHALNISSDGVYFYKVDGGVIAVAGALKAAAASSVNSATAVTTSKMLYEIYFDGTAVYYYHDGGLVTSMAAGFPTAVLAPSLYFANGGAAVRTATVEWMRCIQL